MGVGVFPGDRIAVVSPRGDRHEGTVRRVWRHVPRRQDIRPLVVIVADLDDGGVVIGAEGGIFTRRKTSPSPSPPSRPDAG